MVLKFQKKNTILLKQYLLLSSWKITLFIYKDMYLLFFIYSIMKPQFNTPVAVGLALGIYFGIGLFIFAITARLRWYCAIFVSFVKTFYIGYGPNLGWAFVGLLRWCVDGFIGGFVITLLVQYFQKKFK
jgi:hypothetical protein